VSTDTTPDDHAVAPPKPSIPEPVPAGWLRRYVRLIVVIAFVLVAAASV
jgi:hypothetical protein